MQKSSKRVFQIKLLTSQQLEECRKVYFPSMSKKSNSILSKLDREFFLTKIFPTKSFGNDQEKTWNTLKNESQSFGMHHSLNIDSMNNSIKEKHLSSNNNTKDFKINYNSISNHSYDHKDLNDIIYSNDIHSKDVDINDPNMKLSSIQLDHVKRRDNSVQLGSQYKKHEGEQNFNENIGNIENNKYNDVTISEKNENLLNLNKNKSSSQNLKNVSLVDSIPMPSILKENLKDKVSKSKDTMWKLANPIFSLNNNDSNALPSQILHPFFDTHFHLFSFMRQFHLHRLDLLGMRQMIWTKQYWKRDAIPCIARFTSLHERAMHDTVTSDEVFNQASYWPMYGVFGSRPEFASYFKKEILNRLKHIIRHERSVGIGDLGLLYEDRQQTPESVEDKQSRKKQITLMKALIQIALDNKKPICFIPPQTNEEFRDFMSILKDSVPYNWKIHIHPIHSSIHPDFIHTIQEYFTNVYFGINAEILTLQAKENKPFENILKQLPSDRILLGTDSPHSSQLVMDSLQYSAFQVISPLHIPLMAQSLANLRDEPLSELSIQIRKNLQEMYQIL